MSKIGLLVCGNSGIDYIDHPYDIDVIRSILLVGDNEYTDFIDIEADDFYKMLIENPDLTPSTAQAATGVILEQYEKMVARGYDELLVITVSSKLSGTYEGCMLAAKMLDDVKVTVFDSLTVSYPQAKMGLEAGRMIQEGKQLNEIIERLEDLRDNYCLFFSVETLKYLVKNGRLSGASGFFGSMLKIKPMLEVTSDGRVEAIEKIRTLSKATNRLIEKFIEEVDDTDIEVFIIEAHAQERAQLVKDAVIAKLPNVKSIKSYPLTPVVGAHAGPGVVGIGYIKK
jgi:DegV family protein with EDD domain